MQGNAAGAERLRYVVVGGGAAAASAVEAIRARDAQGSVAVFTREWAPPYQRPPLSKEYLQARAAIDAVLMHPPAWYVEQRVTLHPGVAVERLDTAAKTVSPAGGRSIGYDRLLLATGATPRRLAIPGADLEGVFTLRTYGDAERLRAVRACAQRVVVLGSGFIGMEVAASLRSGGCEVTVATQDATLYERFGADVSAFARGLFERHGVAMVFRSGIASIEGAGGRVSAVVLNGGERVACQAVVIGIGVEPDVALARDAGLHVDDGIVVDDRLRTSAAGVFAAGDVARFPSVRGPLTRVEHFDHAASSGAAAGANMAGADAPYAYVPFFWSDVFELGFEFVGEPAGRARLVAGSLGEGSFVVEYAEGDALRGALLASRSGEERDGYRARLAPG